MIVNPEIFNSSSRSYNLASKPMLICVSDALHDLRLDDFCEIKTTGTKILVGDGPYLKDLKLKYDDVIFVKPKCGLNLAHYYANADVVVCPNGSQGTARIIAEATCCGTPVAARSHVMTDDLIIRHVTGEIQYNLQSAISMCLELDRATIEQLGHILFTKQNNLISHLQ